MDVERCRNEILSELDNFSSTEEEEASVDRVVKPKKRARMLTPALQAFGRDLTDARKGEMDPVVGREKEIRRDTSIVPAD